MKVLIISHNPVSTYHNMGKTMRALFSSFKKEELCQLYIYPTIPDIDYCSSYYRITDKDVLKSYYTFRVKGREIDKSEIKTARQNIFQDEKDEALYRNKKNKKAYRMLARDIMWKCSAWYNKDLDAWLKRETPTCIFVAPGTGKFLYDIALKISKKYRLPIVDYICDDYYFVEKPKGLMNRIKQNLLSKKIEKLILRSSKLVLVCEELSECYFEKFKVPCVTLMTGCNYPIAKDIAIREDPTSLTYMGNIRCNRFTSLSEIGRALDEINKEENTNFSLRIYTGEKDEEILSVFRGVDSIKLCGFVSGEAFDKAFYESEVLLHVEAFDEQSIDWVRHSVSTKIADSLGSGICMFAYAPNEVSSMRHLLRNDCAFAIDDPKALKDGLKELFYNAEKRNQIAKQGLLTARKYHDAAESGKTFYREIESVHENIANQ